MLLLGFVDGLSHRSSLRWHLDECVEMLAMVSIQQSVGPEKGMKLAAGNVCEKEGPEQNLRQLLPGHVTDL